MSQDQVCKVYFWEPQGRFQMQHSILKLDVTLQGNISFQYLSQ